jgi:hypothetical protein
MKDSKELVAFRLPVKDIKNLRQHLMELLYPHRGGRLFDDDYYTTNSEGRNRDVEGATRVISDMISQLNMNYSNIDHHSDDDR